MNRIRFQRTSAGRGNNRVHALRFTFLNSDQDIQTRFEEMATQIRNRIHDYFTFGDLQNHTYLIEFEPADDRARSTRQRVVRRIASITGIIIFYNSSLGNFLSAIYAAMLNSQDTLDLDGFRITVKIIGRLLLRRRAGGGSRPFGAKAIPDRLKKKGLGEHPTMVKKKLEGYEPTSPCGIRALLLGKDQEKYINDFDLWESDSQFLADTIGTTGQFMHNEDFDKIVLLPEFQSFRVLIYSQFQQIIYVSKGSLWKWPDSLPRNEPDSKTISILLDGIDKHYWWVQYPDQCSWIGKKTRKEIQQRCYNCIKPYSVKKFPQHQCSGIDQYQCIACKIFFVNEDVYKNHLAKKNEHYNCEVCKQTTFYGSACFERHVEHNCEVPNNNEKVKCDECGRYTLVSPTHPHDCSNFGHCLNCQEVLDSKTKSKTHRCFMQPQSTYWEPVTDKQWNSHWFYDFETTRGEELEDNVFRHEVMAWCIQLMVPCSITKQFILDQDIRATIEEKLWKAEIQDVECDRPYTTPMPTIRIYGKCLSSFTQVVETILVQRKGQKWKPTLWAHNGSKFDVKFLLDHYVNNEGMDLAGDSYTEEYSNFIPEKKEQEIKWVKEKYTSYRNIVKINLVGSKVLKMGVRGANYQCSHAHHTAPLRDLPKIFDLDVHVKKGEFPYRRLKNCNWDTILPHPTLDEFDVDSMSEKRRTEVIDWYNSLQPTTWDFNAQLWDYLFADVQVGCSVMEAYHEKSEQLHLDIWNKFPEMIDKHVSPLGYCTAPGWAMAMYRSWFLPEKSLAILKNAEGQFIRDSLRGGRTDKRCNWLDITPEAKIAGDKISYFDFKSLYPSVQKCSIHNTHFPTGIPTWGRFNGPTTNEKLKLLMGNKTGFLRVDCHPLKYVTHPTLHRVGAENLEDDSSKRLLFELSSHSLETYAWPELLEAMESGEIMVDHVYDVILFDKGTDTFNDYVDFFFKVKDQAEADKNEGLRSLAKLLLNSLWGKLGQRSYAVDEWVTYDERLDFLTSKFESGEYELISCIIKDDHRAYFKYRIIDDLASLQNTAYQIAAFVSMWGRVVLHKKLLRQHGQRALYCDTDSAIIYTRGTTNDIIPYQGNKLGDLTDEVKKIAPKDFINPYIKEVVFIAPKTYALKIMDDHDKVYNKVVCKGFEPSFNSSKTLHFQAMKELVFTKYQLNQFMNKKRPGDHLNLPNRYNIKVPARLHFESSMARNLITPIESYRSKGLTGDYTKGS